MVDHGSWEEMGNEIKGGSGIARFTVVENCN